MMEVSKTKRMLCGTWISMNTNDLSIHLQKWKIAETPPNAISVGVTSSRQ